MGVPPSADFCFLENSDLESRVDARTGPGHYGGLFPGEEYPGPLFFSPAPASRADRDGLERAADPLHRRDVDAKLLGQNPHARAPRSRQRLTDSFCERRRYRRPAKPLSLAPGPR
jgi:hypothetical protein